MFPNEAVDLGVESEAGNRAEPIVIVTEPGALCISFVWISSKWFPSRRDYDPASSILMVNLLVSDIIVDVLQTNTRLICVRFRW